MDTPQSPTTVTTSKRFTLDWIDAGKGLILAALTPALYQLYSYLDADNEPINWKKLGKIAVTAGVGYLIKNFFSPSKTIIKPPIDGAETK